MNLKKFFNKFNLRKTLSTTIAVIIFIAAIFPIYIYFFKNKIDIQYELLSSINVLEINENIDKLNIIYDGNNLKKKVKI